MNRVVQITACVALCFECASWSSCANSQQPNAPEHFRPAVCNELNIDGRASAPLQPVVLPPQQTCTTPIRNGFPVLDPNCTTGAVNPTLRIEVLRDPSF